MFSKRQLWGLLIPLIIEQLLNSLMGTADTMMVSRAGSAAISAVSLVDAINVLIILVFSAMATGGASICAQYIGRKQADRATETGKQLLLTVASLSVAVMLILILFRNGLLRLIFGKVEADVMENALVYLFITALSYPFIGLYNAGAALFRVCGNSRLPMVISLVCNLVNIAGNAFLIFGLNMGVAGAALATLVSRVLCGVAVLAFLRLPHQAIVIRKFGARPDLPLIRNILSIGLPSGMENGMFQFGKLVIQSTVSTMGTVAIAAQAMTSALEGVTSNAPVGVGLGMMTVAGQCMGAGKVEEAKKSIAKLTFYGGIATLISCAVIALLVRPITVIGGMEAEAAQMCVRLSLLICVVKPLFWPLSFLPAYGMRAAGDVRFSMILSSVTMWVCRVAITIALVKFFEMGPLAVWLGMFADWAVRSGFFFWRYKSGKWAQKAVIRE
ncbi:MAG TPA: MATE family efflux transporter [Candidatus Pullichristensenella excrementigallinarum]|uniref:Probable multidrug resistance protein NorM n=1 Tax=Candidatus Pullichristensenella excrementigallinarum TaxID=2840907 RepID=A0A9D1LAT6_9FIRM|nr:MATE family efflux transporter [Candidatus Pullichristensenella excrementigallinarum]